MNAIERIKMIKAMEFICRNLNNEDHIYAWLTDGVADGDIDYGDLSIKDEDEAWFEYYLKDDVFADLMDTFLFVMRKAAKNGGLYCDDVVSKSSSDMDYLEESNR